MESFNTNFAKAVEELSVNIYIPALISAYLIETGPLIQRMTGFCLPVTYLIVVFLGVLSSWLILVTIMYLGIWFCKGNDISPHIGVAIMPLGFAGLFPEQFQGIDIPYTQVTGMAILAWAFMLVKGKRFFAEHSGVTFNASKQPMKIPYGISKFKFMSTEGYLYVDKTSLEQTKNKLFPRCHYV